MKKENVVNKKRQERFEAYKKALNIDNKKIIALKKVFAERSEAKKTATTDDAKKKVQIKWKKAVVKVVGEKGLETIREINKARKA